MNKLYTIFHSDIVIPHSLNKSYLPELDGLRGLAILTVIIGHTLFITIFGKYFIGNIGVEIFFVLSGFLITSLLLKEKQRNGKVSFKNFYLRRILRILPVAYLFLIVLLILNCIFKLNISAISFVTSAFYLRNINFANTANWFTGHFWTLAIEEQFYLIFPFLLIYNINSYIRLTFILVIGIPILQYLMSNNIGVFHSGTFIYYIAFHAIILFGNGTTSILIGSLLSILMFKGFFSEKRISKIRFISFFTFMAALIFRIIFMNVLPYTYFISTIFSILIACIIYLCITQSNDFLGSFLRNKILIELGLLSYSLYIWQQLFLYHEPWENLFQYSNSLLLNIPALFIVAYLSYTFYEKRFLKLKERFK